jgi:DNA primase catalytic core
MSNSYDKDFINYKLYPALFDKIDIVFPEHSFIKYGDYWGSKTYLNGSPHKDRKDKTKVDSKYLGRIYEQGGDNLSLVDYVMMRDGVGFIEAVKILAEIVGLQVPDSPDWDPEAYKRSEIKTQIREETNNFFIHSLKTEAGADKVRDYLVNSRGFTSEEIEILDFGFIPSQDKLYKYLRDKGFKEDQINSLGLKVKGGEIGSTHILSIPYRSGGSLKGFIFRTLGSEKPKYLYNYGLDKVEAFFNLSGIRGDKDLIIVEGELDCLIAKVRGIDNIVSTGGSSVNERQIQTALKLGAKKFTICLDNDRSPATVNRVNRIIEVISVNRVNRIFIAELPDLGGDKTDPDSFIRDKGVEAFKEIINKAIPYYQYILQRVILPKYELIKIERPLTDKEIDSLLEEIVETATIKILDPLDKDRFKKLCLDLSGLRELGISEDSLSEVIDRIKYKRDRERQSKDLGALLIEAKGLQDKGETDKALDLISSKIKDIKLQDKETEFNVLSIPVREEEIRERASIKPDRLNSGYKLSGEDLLIPAGALTIISAPTGHCKTTLLLNLSQNIAEAYPDKQVYYFNYEESRDSLIYRALSICLGEELSKNNKASIESYFKTGTNKYIDTDQRDFFKEGKDLFFKELIYSGRLNINYITFDSETLIESIRYLHKNSRVGAVLIDYIQLLNLPSRVKISRKINSRQEELKEICLSLKDLSVETGLPIILGAQFNRTVDSLLKIHPTNIGEAGDIERVANLIIGQWFNRFKSVGTQGELNEIAEKFRELGADPEDKTIIYSKILKNRDGDVGAEEIFTYRGNVGKIENRDEFKTNKMSLGTGGR